MAHGGNSHQRRVRRRFVSRQSQYSVTADPALALTDAAYLSTWAATRGSIRENPIFKLADGPRHGGMVEIVSASDFAARDCTPDLTIRVKSGRVVVRDRDGVEVEPAVRREEVSRVMISEEGAQGESNQKRFFELFRAKPGTLVIFDGCRSAGPNFRSATEVVLAEAQIAGKSRPWWGRRS